MTDLDEGTTSHYPRRLLELIGNLEHDRENRKNILPIKLICKSRQVIFVLISFSLLADMAHKKAQRNYSEILFFLYRNNPSLKNDEGGLITGEEFIEALSCSYDLYKEEKFIPLNIPLFEIIVKV